jgi:anti-sigma B factor antagonist
MRHYSAPNNPSVIVAEIVGMVDIHGSTRLLDFMLSLIAQGHWKLVIDVDRADFVDGAGLDALTGVFNAANRHGGYVVLACSQELVLRQCRSAGVTKFFSIWPDSSEAAAFLSSSL